MGKYPRRRTNHELGNGMKMWKGSGNTTTLLFSLKELENLHQEGRGQVNTIVMEHLHKSGPANKQHTYHHFMLGCVQNVHYLPIFHKIYSFSTPRKLNNFFANHSLRMCERHNGWDFWRLRGALSWRQSGSLPVRTCYRVTFTLCYALSELVEDIINREVALTAASSNLVWKAVLLSHYGINIKAGRIFMLFLCTAYYYYESLAIGFEN